MRSPALGSIAIVTLLLFPLDGLAGSLPPGKKEELIDDCLELLLQQGIDEAAADHRCKCSMDAFEKAFTNQELEELLRVVDEADPDLAKRAQDVANKTCPLKPNKSDKDRDPAPRPRVAESAGTRST